MDVFIIGIRPFVKDEQDLELCRAVFEFGLKRIGQDGFDLAVSLRDRYRFELVREELFDQRDDLIDAQVDTLFGFGMNKEDGTVGFDLSNDR